MTRKLQDVGLSIKRVQHRNHRELNRMLAPLGISLVQWDTLRHISQQSGLSMHELALLTFQSDQAFGTLASRMISRGLIKRTPGRGRAIQLNLTKKGAELQRSGSSIVDQVLKETFASLSPSQLETLTGLLSQIQRSL
jgi:DNA-binding MarR family transcriptional regulator